MDNYFDVPKILRGQEIDVKFIGVRQPFEPLVPAPCFVVWVLVSFILLYVCLSARLLSNEVTFELDQHHHHHLFARRTDTNMQ